MKTTDELPDSVNPSQFRNGLPQSPWDQGPTTVVSGGSETHADKGTRSVPIPGGEQIGRETLAAYSNRPDRDYAGAGRASMPKTALGPGDLPRSEEGPKKVGE
jgi:hypothetical protein